MVAPSPSESIKMKNNATLLLNADGQPLNILPLSTLTWQESIKLLVLDRIQVVEWHDDWQVHSQSLTLNVPSVVLSREYIPRSKQGIKFNRKNVFARDKYICQYCGDIFHPKDLTLDHVLPRSKGGKTSWDNIVTACRQCNYQKGNNERIIPRKRPFKPDFFDMTANKSVTLTVSNKNWLPYLDWPEDKVVIG